MDFSHALLVFQNPLQRPCLMRGFSSPQVTGAFYSAIVRAGFVQDRTGDATFGEVFEVYELRAWQVLCDENQTLIT
jgi:hypothetical protein